MIYGAITNSWRLQLENADLLALIGQAQTQGARHIELRQTCLGRAERGEGDDWRPELDYLAGVVQEYPELSFDLAMAYPVLSRDNDPQDGAFQAALAGARLVGGPAPQLRVVDLSPAEGPLGKPGRHPRRRPQSGRAGRGGGAAGRNAVDGERRSAHRQHGAAGGDGCAAICPPNSGNTWASAPTPPTSCGNTPIRSRWPTWRRCRRT